MHPNPAFRFEDDEAMRAFVEERGFAHLFAATPDGPIVAHVPLTRAGGHFRFHLARGNRLAKHLDGATVIASVAGPDGYVSPDWYIDAYNQVPTWNYIAVEIAGTAHRLDEAALIEQLDTLSAVHEASLAPKPPWRREKMDVSRFMAMLGAIQAFELRVTALAGTRKLSQNKSDVDRAGAIAGLNAAGNAALAASMEAS